MICSIRTQGKFAPLIVGPVIGGGTQLAERISSELPDSIPVYGCERPKDDRGYVSDIKEIAAIYSKQLTDLGLRGPFRLLGYSFGAHVMLELARELQQRGDQVEHLFILDDEADVHRRRFGSANETPDPSNIQAVGRHTIDCCERFFFDGQINLFRGANWGGNRYPGPVSDWQYVATKGVACIDFPSTHSEICQHPARNQWVPTLVSVLTGKHRNIAIDGGFFTQSEVHRVPDSAFVAFAAAKKGNLKAEITGYRSALQQQPDAPDWVAINLASALEQSGDLRAAIAVLQQAVKQEPHPANCHIELAQLLQRNGLIEEKHALSKTLGCLVATTASQEMQRGLALLHCGAPLSAAAVMEKALQWAPSQTLWRVRLADLYLQGDHQKAEQLIDEGLAICPTAQPLLKYKAEKLASNPLQNMNEAELRSIIEKNPRDWTARLCLMTLFYSEGRINDALALTPPPESAELGVIPLLNFAAELLADCDDALAAEATFKRVLSIADSNIRARLGLSHLLQKQGNLVAAIHTLKSAPAQTRANPQITRRLGEIVMTSEIVLCGKTSNTLRVKTHKNISLKKKIKRAIFRLASYLRFA